MEHIHLKRLRKKRFMCCQLVFLPLPQSNRIKPIKLINDKLLKLSNSIEPNAPTLLTLFKYYFQIQ